MLRKNKIKKIKKYLKFLLTKHNIEWYNKTRSEQSGTKCKAHWKVNNKLWNSFEKNNSRWIKTKGLCKTNRKRKIIKSQRTKNLILKEKSLK